ncbi:Cas10/Cmr2 second palm domain-containing protein [Arachnia propionica]|uniref:Cas10/Cmr2 second palm domain-containing protein n=1 Tax=Arachnia propionica TaxID=1750 RepID=UPI003C6EA61D
MTTYVVIGAKRIQQWIARTPRLALTKGASQALTTRTSRDYLSGRLPEELRLSDEVPDIAGVVVLESDEPVADDVVDAALMVVAEGLPGLEWNAWVHEADSYVEAYQAMGGGQRCTRIRHRVPSARRLPMLTECAGCHEESAEVLVAVPEGKDSYGADCVVRREGFKEWKRDLKPREDGVAEPEMFEHLTKLEEPGEDDHPVRAMGRRDADNHLALILADGNRMGDFFKKVAQLKDPQAHKALSKALDDATQKAAERARNDVMAKMVNPRYCPDVLHYIGGDDVMASVAGRFAWLWAVTLAKAFETEFRSRVDEVCANRDPQFQAVRTAAGRASLGVGMVFTHYKAPFAGARELAEEMEKIAKKTGKGEKSYIAWADTTADHKALERNVIDTERASRELREGHVLRGLGPSARGALKQELDAGRDAVAWATRTRRYIVEYLGQSSEDQIRADLDRARWWPVVEKTKEGQE